MKFDSANESVLPYTLASTTFVPAASAATTFGAEGRSPMDAIRPSAANGRRPLGEYSRPADRYLSTDDSLWALTAAAPFHH